MGNLYAPGAWDDLAGAVSMAKLPPATTPTWRDYDFGIAAGLTFPVLGFAVNDYLQGDYQTSHSMILNSLLENHFHYTTPTDGTGDKIKFQLDCIAAGVNGTWAVPSGSPYTAEVTMDGDYSDKHKLFEIGEIAAVNTTVSSLYKCRLTRIAASADEYAGEVYVSFFDAHYQKDGIGSAQELSKDPA
jgi:hypothetical protein